MTALFGADRIFGIAPGADFSVQFVNGLRDRLMGTPPEALARVTIITNTQRAKRRLETVFAQSGPVLLPQIRVISDLARDPLLVLPDPPTEPAVASRLRLTQLVRKLLETDPGLAPPAAAFDLSGSLAELMDELAGAGIPLDAFETLNVETASQHWQTALQFLRLLAQVLPKTGHATGAEARQKLAVAALARIWAVSPPQGPVIVAGSTGSRSPTSDLMQAVLALPDAAIVLPGFDPHMNTRSWETLANPDHSAADHPQYGFASLASRIGFDVRSVQPWRPDLPETPRARLISLALRPAPVTDEWRSEGPALVPALDAALVGCDLLTAPNERAEAAAIAAALRAGLNTGTSVALITPDGTLARRVTANLSRWGILPDESAGQPMHLSPEGVFLGLLLTWLDTRDPVTLTAILKHPLCASQGQRGPHLLLTRLLDAELLRDIGPTVAWRKVRDWAADHGPSAESWVLWLERCLDLPPEPPHGPLAAFVDQHRNVAITLAAGHDSPQSDGPNPFWNTEPGLIMDHILSDLTQSSPSAGPISPRDYRAIFDTMARAEKKRLKGFVPDQRVLIWGQLEARVQSADLIVLAGLNEGTWPAQPPPDPWLSRQMRQQIGLSTPERRIGLAAHDFQQAASAPRVILSRSARQDNQPTVPSRWLVRLENLVCGLGDHAAGLWKAATARGDLHLARAEALAAPAANVTPERRPAPIVPLSARPDRIYVTHTEQLVRDPYAYYARHILRLHELPRAGRSADPRDRGNALHLVLEKFVADTLAGLPDTAETAFLAALDHVMDNDVPWPAQARFWRARLARLAQDFIAAERARRHIAQPAKLETKGQVPIPGFARDLHLAAKADRIDLAPDGSVAIYDYKSRLDTPKQIKAFAKQLPLESRMAAMGGFLDGSERRTARLELIGLSKPGEAHAFDLNPEDIEEVWQEFLRLVAHYEDPNAAYPSRLRVMKERDDGDYDHLARRGEWPDGQTFLPERME